MNDNKYKLTTAIVSLVISAMSFTASLICMIYYAKATGSTQANIIMLPFLFICVFLTLASTIFSFINLSSRIGKIAFLLSVIAIAFVITSFILLF